MFRFARVAIPHLVDRVVIITEDNIDPVELSNARLLHAAAVRPEQENDNALATTVKRLTGPVTIREISTMSGLGADGLFTVARAIWQGTLACDRTQKIELQTRVHVPDGASS